MKSHALQKDTHWLCTPPFSKILDPPLITEFGITYFYGKASQMQWGRRLRPGPWARVGRHWQIPTSSSEGLSNFTTGGSRGHIPTLYALMPPYRDLILCIFIYEIPASANVFKTYSKPWSAFWKRLNKFDARWDSRESQFVNFPRPRKLVWVRQWAPPWPVVNSPNR